MQMNDFPSTRKQNHLADALRKIPPEAWYQVVKKGPEWYELEPLRYKFSDGAFSVFMLAIGLNAYQLKGRAELNYFPQLNKCIKVYDSVPTLGILHRALTTFYKKERLNAAKIDRLTRFLQSPLALQLWMQSPQEIANSINPLRHSLGDVMRQKLDDKTICFAMKCLGVSLMMAGEFNFDFQNIPVPVDSRISKFTKSLGIDFGDKIRPIQCFWKEVLSSLRSTLPQISIIHLDSLIWQIAHLNEDELRSYFEDLGIDQSLYRILCF